LNNEVTGAVAMVRAIRKMRQALHLESGVLNRNLLAVR
jgi:hypothetical protein